jgi:hypothetical protein
VRAVIDDFLSDQRTELNELRKAVGAKLDLSYESLDRVEDYYRGVVEATPEMPALKPTDARIASYVGATLAEHTKGTWSQSTQTERPVAAIKVPGLKRTFDPMAPVLGFARRRIFGLLRDMTERWDLRLRRATLARLVESAKQEAARLIEDVAQLTGQRVTTLDKSAKSVKLVEAALKAVAGNGVSHARRREVRERVVLHLGNLVAEAAGGGKWEVVADPELFNFGELEIAGWSPALVVRAIDAKTAAGSLHEALEEAIEEAT